MVNSAGAFHTCLPQLQVMRSNAPCRAQSDKVRRLLYPTARRPRITCAKLALVDIEHDSEVPAFVQQPAW